ncbi:hypothetical protein ABIF86_004529 [Bradyrhizobium japonicum]
MSRRRYSWDERRIAGRLGTGRGLGSGADYTPWLTTADVPSRGRSHRVFWRTSSRVHHFLSDNEYASFLHHCYDDDVIDIREQFPLERIDTMMIAEMLGVRHPVDRCSRAPLVMTTDLLVTRRVPHGKRQFAYAIKEDEDLKTLRTIEKLEIERVYWSIREVCWQIQLRSELKTNTALNLAWLFDSDFGVQVEGDWAPTISAKLRTASLAYPTAPIRLVCRLLDDQLGLERGAALSVVRALLARKELLVDLNRAPPLAEVACAEFHFPEVGL